MQLRPVVLVTEEQRLRELVVKPTTATTSETAIGQLTKAIETFSVNLLQQVQSQQSTGGLYRPQLSTDTTTDGTQSALAAEPFRVGL
jgi:hypothetical protein